jgi:outer membrane protein assembly factor BamD
MKKFLSLALLVVCGVLAFPPDCPAPLVWRRGEGWSWERHGMTVGANPQEQLKIAQQLQKDGAYGDAIVAYRRLIGKWPTAFAVEEARLGMAECYSKLRYYFRAFNEYQALIDKHPNTSHFNTVLQRQYEVGNLFYAGERDKAFGVRWFPNIGKAVTIYEQVIKNGPHSEIAPQAQYRIGLTKEKQKEYVEAVRAYEKVTERYPKHSMAEEAYFQIGMAYKSESARAEYDQNAANQSVAGFTDFLVRYPKSEKAPLAENYRTALKEEQSRGLFHIGQFYEKKRSYKSALIYYNEVIEQNPQSDWATRARDKIDTLTPLTQTASAK